MEIQIFFPLTRYCPFSFTAWVFSRVVFRPTSGSVTPKATLVSPLMMPGRWAAFWASLPCTTRGLTPKMFMCTEEQAAMHPPEAAASCSIRAASVMPSPLPP